MFSVLNTALGRVRLPAIGVGVFKSIPLARRVIPMSAGMHIIFVWRCPSGPPSTEYTLPTGRGLTRGDRRTTGRLLEVRRCALGSGASLPAVWKSMLGRARLLGLAQSSRLLDTRRPPRRFPFDPPAPLQLSAHPTPHPPPQ